MISQNYLLNNNLNHGNKSFIYISEYLWNEYASSSYSYVFVYSKKHGHEIQIFDTTYYSLDYGMDSDGSKMERLNVVPI